MAGKKKPPNGREGVEASDKAEALPSATGKSVVRPKTGGKPLVYRLTLTAAMTAFSVVLCRFVGFSPADSSIRLEIGFLPIAVLATVLNPFYSGIGYLLADIIGSLMQGYAPNIWIMGCKFLFGFIMGLFFYKKKPTFPRALLAFLVINTLVDVVLMTPIFIFMYGQPPLAAYWIRGINSLVTYPVRVLTYYYLVRVIYKYVNKSIQ